MSGQATYDLDIRLQKKQTQIVGGISYSDPAAGLSVHSTKITSLIFSGNHAHFTETAKLSKKKSISFTVDINDNSVPTGPLSILSQFKGALATLRAIIS